mmetsp:Transcript_119995/g.301613  ORF Transcript_119995/g.301613 Transcript_119995/m.301613 type:complete len:248 (+) Transcript_119995:3-746(+)
MSSESTPLPATEATACLTVPLKLARVFEDSVSCQKSRFSMSMPKTTEGLCGTSSSYLSCEVSVIPRSGTTGSGRPSGAPLPLSPPVVGECGTTASGSPGSAWVFGCRVTPGSGDCDPPRWLAPREATPARWQTSSTTSAAPPAPPRVRAAQRRRAGGNKSASSSASLALPSSESSPNPSSAVTSFSKSSMSLSDSSPARTVRQSIDCSNLGAERRKPSAAWASCSGLASLLLDMGWRAHRHQRGAKC